MSVVRRIQLHPSGSVEVPRVGSEFLSDGAPVCASIAPPQAGIDYVLLRGSMLRRDRDCAVVSCGGLLATLPPSALAEADDRSARHTLYLYHLHER